MLPGSTTVRKPTLKAKPISIMLLSLGAVSYTHLNTLINYCLVTLVINIKLPGVFIIANFCNTFTSLY